MTVSTVTTLLKIFLKEDSSMFFGIDSLSGYVIDSYYDSLCKSIVTKKILSGCNEAIALRTQTERVGRRERKRRGRVRESEGEDRSTYSTPTPFFSSDSFHHNFRGEEESKYLLITLDRILFISDDLKKVINKQSF